MDDIREEILKFIDVRKKKYFPTRNWDECSQEYKNWELTKLSGYEQAVYDVLQFLEQGRWIKLL